MKKILLSLAVLGLLGAALPLRAQEAAPLTIKPTSDVTRPTVWLGDVFTGLPKGIDRAIATAPQPGKSVTYDARVLTRLADQYKLEWAAQSPADQVVITRPATHVSAEAVRAGIMTHLVQDTKVKDASKLEVSIDGRVPEFDLPSDQPADFRFERFTYDVMGKRFKAVVVAQNGGALVKMPVSGRVTILRDVPVLARRLSAGTIVSASDLDWLTVSEDKTSGDVIAQTDELIGRELRRDTPEGQLLHTRDVLSPRLVTRGSLVSMKIETPMMLITTQGKALQDGTKGDVVRILNTQSNRTVEATVESSGVVVIMPSARRVALNERGQE